MILSVSQVQCVRLAIRPSIIHGKGLFTQENVSSGALIYESDEYTVTSFPIYGSLQHTPTEHILEDFLRWENHSCKPNSCLRFDGSAVQLIATVFISADEEIVCDYRTTEDSIPTPFRCNCGHCDAIIIR